MQPRRQEVRIDSWSWDEENEEHLRRFHPEMRTRDVDSVLDHPWIALENVGKDRRAEIAVLGMDDRGRGVVVAADPTGQVGVWRPVTAHPMRSRWQVERYASETGKEVSS